MARFVWVSAMPSWGKCERSGDDSATLAALLPLPCARANAAQRQKGLVVVVFMFAGVVLFQASHAAIVPTADVRIFSREFLPAAQKDLRLLIRPAVPVI